MAEHAPAGPDAGGRLVRLDDGDMRVAEDGKPGAPASVVGYLQADMAPRLFGTDAGASNPPLFTAAAALTEMAPPVHRAHCDLAAPGHWPANDRPARSQRPRWLRTGRLRSPGGPGHRQGPGDGGLRSVCEPSRPHPARLAGKEGRSRRLALKVVFDSERVGDQVRLTAVHDGSEPSSTVPMLVIYGLCPRDGVLSPADYARSLA